MTHKITSFSDYKEIYKRSVEQPEQFWTEIADSFEWRQTWDKVLDWNFKEPNVKWFLNGKLNITENCIDRHLESNGDKAAIIWESNDANEPNRTLTYNELHAEVCRFSNVLQNNGIEKGDRVCLYMPMIPELAIAVLACARVGAIHSVVFAGFSSQSLSDRINDSECKVLVTADGLYRGNKTVGLKEICDEALQSTPSIHKVIVYKRTGQDIHMQLGRDVWWHSEMTKAAKEFEAVEMDSEDPLFILYTSGSTGKPKGVVHSCAGYMVYTYYTFLNVFQYEADDVFWCTADVGWITGHSYIVYGPLLNGNTTIMYEGVPLRPDPAIWWKICAENKVKTMFSSPTAVRVLKKQDPKFMQQHKLPALKYLFLAGEPLDEPTARWVSDALGGVAIVDNYWQTESGWPILSAQVGIEDTPRKFGSPSFPVYGFNVKLKSETGGAVGADEKAVLVIEAPLPPGALMTVWGDDERFVKTYFGTFSDEQVYSTFDWATRDKDGYYFILGRTDDVINVAGHRLGTREIEEAVQANPLVAECAVVGVADQLKGQIPVAFVVLKDPSQASDATKTAIAQTVDKEIGAIARPGAVHLVTLLPKTRSGKLLRRSIQALAEGRDPGDLTTIEDPAALAQIKAALGVK